MSIWNLSTFLKNKFLRICPYGKKQLNGLIHQCVREILILEMISIVLLVIWNRMFWINSELYMLESILLALYLVCKEVPAYRLQERENIVYRDLLLYLSRVKHRYLSCHHIANAIIDAADGMSYEMEQLAWEMYRLLMESNRKEKVREYMECRDVNRYWKMFLIQAYEVSEKGNSYFAENVEHIRLELMEEIYRRRRRLYAYSGYVFVTIAPFLLLPVLKYWGLEFTPELDFFYAGTGRILETLIFVMTIAIYDLITNAKEIALFSGINKDRIFITDIIFEWNITRKFVKRIEQSNGKISTIIRTIILQSGEHENYGKFCVKMFLKGVLAACMMMLFFTTNHLQERKAILERVENIEEIAPVVSADKKDLIEGYILEITDLCRQEQNVEQETIREMLRKRIRLGNEFTEQAVIEEIMEKLQLYTKTKGSLLEFLLCIFSGVVVGILPLIKLIFQIGMIRAEAEYEVKQFQSVVLMERRIPGITVLGLLEDMESFSNCFKGVLRRCINSYGSDSKAALLRMKTDGSKIHAGMEPLADAFLSVDEVGIEKAFAEVENDRRLLEKISRLDAEVAQEKKRDAMELLSQIPMILSVGVYFILPFFLHSLQSVSDVFKLLEEMQM